MSQLQEWLNRLEGLHPKEIDLTLDRIVTVAKRLQVDAFQCPVITVAGTNGKGSTVETLRSIYHQADYRVGAYTSPHLLRYNERIQLPDGYITDEELCDHFQHIDTVRAEISLTYFEFATLAALLAFKRHQLDVIILEVGLGGRLDATNIINPTVAVISSISLDHTQWLGETREAIASEKAGIIRPHQPVVYGENDVPQTIIQRAKKLAAPLFIYGRDFFLENNQWRNETMSFDHLPPLQLPPSNVACALQVVTLLHDQLPVSNPTLALVSLKLNGRMQYIAPNIVVDVAHNPASIAYLAEQLKKIPGKKRCVFAMLQGKDFSSSLEILNEQVDSWYLGAIDQFTHRALTTKALAEKLTQLNAKFSVDDHIHRAYQRAKQTLTADETLMICGSFYTVSAILEFEGF